MIQHIATSEKSEHNIDEMRMPALMIPSFRNTLAKKKKLEKNFLICTQGGLGDVICAEPAIRYAVKNFKHVDITLDSYFPELFGHLEFKNINNANKSVINFDDYLVFNSLEQRETLSWEFLIHPFMHVVDHSSMLMWHCQLPIDERTIILQPSDEDYALADSQINPFTDIVIHAGRTWQSRTIPAWFWTEVIQHIVKKGYRPVLIGKESHGQVGNLIVDTEGCLDLRDKLNLMQTVAVLHGAKCLLTNDSSPVHMAASGNAWVGFLSTVKFPEYITHWRKNLEGKTEFGWRMKNWTKGGMWEQIEVCPIGSLRVYDIRLDHVDQDLLNSWLPDPKQYADWSIECLQTHTSIPQ